MKTILAICALTLLGGGAVAWRTLAGPARFGAFSSAPKTELAQVISHPKAFLGKTIELEGAISEQCKSMGCFFFFRSGRETLRVDLQDIAMKAPMKEGHLARVEGQLVPYNDGYQLSASAVEIK